MVNSKTRSGGRWISPFVVCDVICTSCDWDPQPRYACCMHAWPDNKIDDPHRHPITLKLYYWNVWLSTHELPNLIEIVTSSETLVKEDAVPTIISKDVPTIKHRPIFVIMLNLDKLELKYSLLCGFHVQGSIYILLFIFFLLMQVNLNDEGFS